MKKTTKKQEAKGLLKNPKKVKRIALGVGLGFLAIFVIWLYPFTRPMVAYPYYFLNCGFKQPIVGGLGVYHVPGQKRYSFYGLKYFCTENEAKNHGYTRYSLGE